MKAREIKSRDDFFYAEYTGDIDYTDSLNGIVVQFKKSRDYNISGVVVKSSHPRFGIGHNQGTWSNPLIRTKRWKIVPKP